MALTPEQVTALQDEITALKTEIADLKSASKKAAKFAREMEIKNLFASLNREYKEEDVIHYIDMTAEQFSATAKDLLSMKVTELPGHLFEAQAKDGVEESKENGINFAAIYQQRNGA